MNEKVVFEDAFKKVVFADENPKVVFGDEFKKLIFDVVNAIGIFDYTFDDTFE